LLAGRSIPAASLSETTSIERPVIEIPDKLPESERDIVVRFQKRAHNPLAMAAGFDKTDQPIPWLGNRRLQLVFG
jgi:hypothetical protein